LWVKDARLPLQNGMQNLRLLSELQRLLLKTMASGDLISSEKCFEIEHKPEIAVLQWLYTASTLVVVLTN
jgi:hypothetical protein